MDKVKNYIGQQLKESEDNYWNTKSILNDKIVKLKILQDEVQQLQIELNNYDAEKKHYQELYDDLVSKENK